MTTPTPPAAVHTWTDVAGVLNDFANRVRGVTHVMLVAADGLPLAASRVDRDTGDGLAALTAALLALAEQGGDLLHLGSPENLTIRFPTGHLIFMRTGISAGLAVAAANGTDLRVAVHEMFQLIDSVGPLLTPQIRHDLGGFNSGAMVMAPGRQP